MRTPRTRRNHPVSVLTSMQPGVCVPIACIPMLREDSLRASMRVAVEMLETHEILLNSTRLRVTAYVVPFQAYTRFQGSRDQLDRSYMGQPQIDGGSVVNFFENLPADGYGVNPIRKYLGDHAKPGDSVNTFDVEGYNLIWNMRAKNRSPNIAPRARLATSLAPAFWMNSQWEHVVPDFDQAVIDGEVALNVVNNRVKVKGLYLDDTVTAAALVPINPTGATTTAAATNARKLYAAPVPEPVYAEMAEAGITVSLAGLAQARKAQWFAKMREKYQGHDDEYIIDMLMSGLTIPDLSMNKPILIADVTTKFAQAKRYATDSGNLAESAVSGAAVVEFDLNVPQINTGGMVFVIAEALPDQLFERQRNPFLYANAVSQLPDYQRDELDVEKVDIVKNAQVDVDHATPAATFGYEPMNAKWNRVGPKLGGKFLRPSAGSTNDEQRQRVWAIETVNPVLGADFYLVKGMHLKPFLDTANDPFEVAVSGNAVISGNTVFGGLLVENTNLYDKVMAKAPAASTQIVK